METFIIYYSISVEDLDHRIYRSLALYYLLYVSSKSRSLQKNSHLFVH
jgi:hypothetical protein